jgi:hypothetical protein
MNHYTTMSSVRQCMTTTAALDEGVGRLATHERLRLSVNTILNTRSDRTRAAQVHHFRLRPARLAANHARHDHSVFAMPMPRGDKGGVEHAEVDYDAGCLVRSTSTKCPTKKAGEGATDLFGRFQ